MTRKILSLILLSVFLFTTNSCKKDKPEDNPKPSEKTLTLISDNVEPGQIVLAQSSEAPGINADSKISISGQEVKAFDAGSNQIGFLMPVLPAGKVSIDYTNAGIPKKLDITIKQYAEISEPEIAINNFISESEKAIANLNEHVQNDLHSLDPEHIEFLEYLKQTIKDNFTQLSKEDQIRFAYYLRSNTPNPSAAKLDSVNQDFYLKKGNRYDDAGEALVNSALAMDKNLIVAVPAITLGVGLIYLPAPTGFDKLAGCASLFTGLICLDAAISHAKQVGNLTGVAEVILEGIQKKAEKLVFTTGKEEKISFTAKYRNLSTADQSSANSVISSIFSSLNKLSDTYNKTVELANTVKSWFPWKSPKLPLYSNPIGQQSKNQTLPLPGDRIVISNVSNPEIKVTYIQGSDHVKVKASSETIDNETDFTFTVKFTDPNLGIVLEKQIEATLKPKVYFLLDDENKWVVTPIKFQSGKGRSFFISEDKMTKANGIDYSQITYENATSGSKIQVTLNKNAGSFTIIPSHEEKEMQYANIRISYKGKFVQTVGIEVASPCANTTAPIISLKEVKCLIPDGNGQPYQIFVSFSAPQGDGVVIGAGSGHASEESEGYPTRLYFVDTENNKSIAYNGYKAELYSGNTNAGVVKITIYTTSFNPMYYSCEPTSDIKVQKNYYKEWTIKMRDKCMNWSNEVSTTLIYYSKG